MENDSHDLVCASYWEMGLAGGKAIFSPKWDGQVGDVGYCSLQLPRTCNLKAAQCVLLGL